MIKGVIHARSLLKSFPTPDGDVVAAVEAFLADRLAAAVAAGIPRSRVVLDAGLDLGKTAEQSLALLRASDRLAALGQPLLLSLVLSIVLSPLLLNHNKRSARCLLRQDGPPRTAFERESAATREIGRRAHVILCGFGRVGQNVARVLESQGFEYIALDLDPARIAAARQAGLPGPAPDGGIGQGVAQGREPLGGGGPPPTPPVGRGGGGCRGGWEGRAGVDGRENGQFVIMARTDAHASEGAQAAIDRARAYVEAGADMIFAEALHTLDEYRAFTEALDVPVLANITEFGRTPLNEERDGSKFFGRDHHPHHHFPGHEPDGDHDEQSHRHADPDHDTDRHAERDAAVRRHAPYYLPVLTRHHAGLAGRYHQPAEPVAAVDHLRSPRQADARRAAHPLAGHELAVRAGLQLR